MRPQTSEHLARLLIHCPDRPGIVSKVTTFFAAKGANITALNQYCSSAKDGHFFMRLEFQLAGIDTILDDLKANFDKKVAQSLFMQWQLNVSKPLKKVAIFVSKTDHCLLELLWRHARQELPMDIVKVFSNHPDCERVVKNFSIPFEHVPYDDKQAAEKRLTSQCEDVDAIVLARFMQILSPEFVKHFQNRIINIHHSFLPAFMGASPYQQAYDKGVKLIGATAHYVTSDLDEGPIIHQDVVRVNHEYQVDKLKELGQDVERAVLACALRWHLEDRVMLFKNKTIVFN